MKPKNKLEQIFTGGLVNKFILWIVGIIVVGGIITTIFVQINLNNSLEEEFHERGQSISRNLASSSVEPLLIEDSVNLHRLVEDIKKTERDVKYVYITDTKGRVLAHTFDGGFPLELLSSTQNARKSLLDTGEGYVIDFSSSILEGRAGFVHVGLDETYLNLKISQTRQILIGLTFIVSALGILMAYIAGNHLTRPVRALVKGAEEIGKGNLGYQIEPGPIDETYVLSEAFNEMSLNLKNSINELRASEERYRKLVDGISDAVMMIDAQGTIRSWNRAAHEMFGWRSEDIKGREFSHLYHSYPETTSTLFDGERTFLKKNGSTFPGMVNEKAIQEGLETYHVVVIRDITEQKKMAKLERQLLQSDKLATIGQLASGVAHEMNNPLGNISLYTQMLLKKSKDKSSREKLEIVNEEANRAARIVKGLLDFARQSDPKLEPIDVNREIEKVLNILSPQLRKIKITTELQPLPRIMADSGQIRQVIMDIMTNSIQAITTDGKITIKTDANRDYVNISVSDNGCGIPRENLDKIFDPFFTTKETGEGTGLGLSICHGIIERHNGSIEVESEVKLGTTIKIKLPK